MTSSPPDECGGVVALGSTAVANPSTVTPSTAPTVDTGSHGNLLPRSGSAICCTLVSDQGADLLMRPLRTSRRVVYSIMGRGENAPGRLELTEVADGEQPQSSGHGGQCPPGCSSHRMNSKKRRNEDRRMGYEALTTALSALYAKLLVVLGVALPVTEVISTQVPAAFYHGFYLYLYSGSLLFVFLMHASLIRQRAVFSIVKAYHSESGQRAFRKPPTPVQRYCSFYLRVGAIGFGIGSMIYSGLEFGQFFELRKEQKCHKVLHAVTPVTRMLLTLLQMQFIFLNNKLVDIRRHKMFARFGLMHMIAMNMCEWLYVIVEETKHEIVHLTYPPHGDHHDYHEDGSSNATSSAVADLYDCRRTNIMGTLVQNASPFLFPCTIEYSLICAVILYAMWKDVSRYGPSTTDSPAKKITATAAKAGRSLTARSPSGIFRRPSLTHHHQAHSAELFSVDCANAHRGLFAGILVLVLTIISLITFFVLVHAPGFEAVAVFEVTVCEMVLYVLTTIAVIVCTVQMRDLRYRGPQRKLGMDNALLVTAQTGMYVYCMFAIVGAYFARGEEREGGEGELKMTEDAKAGGVAAELCSLVQTTCQTIFVLDAWCRKCRTEEQCRRKPGRQLVTFLLVANMAMWTINTLEKNRAEFHPTHLHFYGVWAWTIITHVSMPLAIFYRFHSTVCLYEIWKNAYKMKPEPKSQVHRS
ncbi:proton channel OtopLc-like isoform X2 [Ischnura elegans]|uniref:proton channel OtopLc-like isoform X2 n=1 Tax=Ischnura elegans TaxID=197161 RepID=UPI001ED869B6|nr:proton channel OtopLc-like isoform X2 [Ischnura elegans]